MTFPWYEPDVPRSYSGAGAKAAAMYEQELRQRAALLLRLGYSREETRFRLLGNVKWDFELQPAPPHLKLVDRIVEDVFRAGGLGGGGTPSLEL